MGEKNFRLVIIETPYNADTPKGIENNLVYARACMKDCLSKGESPFASHLLYTQPGVLRDNIPEERKLGIQAGLAWGKLAEASIFYTDRGISSGMKQGFVQAVLDARPREFRTLPNYQPKHINK
ncbi:hypothetical protein COU54_03980 [Candidatus Pacearchaeota archaeon CG10_big_fil_rev_8_21_14_0_10_31_24]|nr:MAG: hypothetical protein COU54_03980 [Candidatus Pacearchaeota archaeon CG10_big_fil_rev_8_21_14_0_10_31_24]